MRKTKMIIISISVLLVGGSLVGPVLSHVEQAKYTVVEKASPIEIRDYPPALVAEVRVQGERKEAINQGFKILADYIFGGNKGKGKIAMTAPVIQTSEPIAMTAPVEQVEEGKGWTVKFVMPSNYTLETIPQPLNDKIKLSMSKQRRMAAIRFSGSASAEDLRKREEQLAKYLRDANYSSIGKATHAYYNPPITLPIFRRNEVMFEVEKR